MKKYACLFLMFIRFSFSRQAHFRIEFLQRVVMDLLYYFIGFLVVDVVYKHVPIVDGWSHAEMRIFVAASYFIDAFHMTFFANSIWTFPELVNRGDLDYYLIRPVSSLFYLTTRDISVSSFVNFLIAAGIFFYCLAEHSVVAGFFEVVFLIFNLFMGLILLYFSHVLFVIPVFWTGSNRGFMSIYYSFYKTIERPDTIFKGFFRLVVVTILPLAVAISFPVKIYLRGFDLQTYLHLTGLTIIYALLVIGVWKKALRSYSSASS